MKNKKIILLGVAVLIFVFFYYNIPVTLVHSSKFFWAFVGSVLTGVCIILAGINNDNNRYDVDNYKANGYKEKLFIVPGILIMVFGAFFLYFKFSSRTKAFLEANPYLVSGTVVDGQSETTTRRGSKSTTYELTVSFSDSNGTSHKEKLSVTGSEWDLAGKGMPVSVVYEKNNPDICKVILNVKEAMAYVDKRKRLYPTIKDLQTFIYIKDYKDQLKLLGDYWGVSKSEDVEDGIQFTNTLSHDEMLVSKNLGNIYLNEREQDISFNAILTEAKKTMKVVFDSINTNSKKGIFLENDSMQIRFQIYNNYKKKERSSTNIYDLSYLGSTITKIYCFGFAKKDKGSYILLPGDLESLNPKSEEDKLMEIINQK